MSAARPLSALMTCDQWARATHTDTAVDGERQAVVLGWHNDDLAEPRPAGDCEARGLAVDRLCRVYRLTATGVERLVVGPTAGGVDYRRLPDPTPLFGAPPPAVSAPFTPSTAPVTPLSDPVGIAVDADDRLFVSERGTRRILVFDLWSRRLLRRVPVTSLDLPDRRPAGLGARGRTVYAVVQRPSGLLRLTARRGPEEVDLPDAVSQLPPGSVPVRVAVHPSGEPVLLFVDPDGAGWLVAGEREPFGVGAASDIAVDAGGVVVVAGCGVDGDEPADPFSRVALTASAWARALPLDGRGYDGGGIVATADGRIGYWTASGFRLAVGARVRYEREGGLVSYRFDSGVPLNRWGRVYLEACIPPGTDVRVAVRTADDPSDEAIPWTAADPAACEPAPTPDPPPPLPPPELEVPLAEVTGRLHRRRDSDVEWWRPAAGDHFEPWETTVQAPPGRYLWVTLKLTGDTRSTPMVGALRVEHTAHTLLRRLPRLYSEEPVAEDFLHRQLSMFDSLLADLGRRSARRDHLVDPASVPEEALAWLASFLGMVLDERWPVAARRKLVREAMRLYRFRGTPAAIARYLEIYLDVRPVIVEHFRLGGMPGMLAGDADAPSRRSVVGLGLQLGGALGDPGLPDPLAGGASRAHRFTVLVPRRLDAEQAVVVRHVLETERPAHTVYELCVLDAGMRVGTGIHVGLSSMVGRTGEFEPTILGDTLLGRRSVLGRPDPGGHAGTARVGATARVG